jgi:hypothetical protein
MAKQGMEQETSKNWPIRWLQAESSRVWELLTL